jgi:hypothetical protein
MTTSLYSLQEILEIGYTIDNKTEVGRFLSQNTFLIPILGLLYAPIQSFFPNAPLSLEVIRDPEIPGQVQLLVNILTELEIDEALKELRKFDLAWWLKNAPLAQGKLIIDLG